MCEVDGVATGTEPAGPVSSVSLTEGSMPGKNGRLPLCWQGPATSSRGWGRSRRPASSGISRLVLPYICNLGVYLVQFMGYTLPGFEVASLLLVNSRKAHTFLWLEGFAFVYFCEG